jgi:hypothetical protein
MDAVTFWSSLEPLGMLRLVVRTSVGLIEVDRVFDRPQLSERFVNFPGRPIDLHVVRGLTYQLDFHDGYHEHTGRVEHGIIARDGEGATLFSLFLVRPEGSDEHDPERVAAFRAFREKAEAATG